MVLLSFSVELIYVIRCVREPFLLIDGEIPLYWYDTIFYSFTH